MTKRDLKRDVVFWFPHMDPYYSDRFERLFERGNTSFECWYSRPVDLKRSWEIDQTKYHFPRRFLPTVGIGRRKTGLPFEAFSRCRPKVLVTHHGDAVVALSAVSHFLPGVDTYYYVEKTFDTWYKRRLWKEHLKSWLMTRAEGFLSPGLDADAYIRQYAGQQANIFRLNQVIRHDHFATAVSLREDSRIRSRRQTLGLDGLVLLYVGRVWRSKGLDTLLSAYEQVAAKRDDIALLIVGDGADFEYYRNWCDIRGIPRVVFQGFVQQDRLPEIYALGDVFVFPTRGDPYGLVVDEALASGLPVLASDHAGEISERVIAGETGYLFHVDDQSALVELLEAVLQNPEHVTEMSRQSTQKFADRTPDSWCEQVEEFLRSALAKK